MFRWYSIQLSLNTRPLIWLSDWHATKAFLILSVIQLTACLAFMQLLFPVSTKTGYVCSKSKTKCSSYARDKSPERSEISYYFCTSTGRVLVFIIITNTHRQRQTDRQTCVCPNIETWNYSKNNSKHLHTHTSSHTSNRLITSYWQLSLLFELLLASITSATFPLTFAYISDCVEDKKKRAPAFGLALATFGLSFCLGPVSGSYLAKQFGDKSVFLTSFVLVLVNISYIVFFLPETVKVQVPADVRTYVPLEKKDLI